jgi:hypothetical protein
MPGKPVSDFDQRRISQPAMPVADREAVWRCPRMSGRNGVKGLIAPETGGSISG